MANYYGAERSNYFRVKDQEVFRKFCADMGWKCHVDTSDPGLQCILPDPDLTDNGCFNRTPPWADPDDDYPEVPMSELIRPHLAPDSVFILVGNGAEKLRYLSGYAMAFQAEGDVVEIDIDAITTLARDRWPTAEVTDPKY